MERYSEVVGLPVVCIDSGKRLGTVKDVIFSPSYKRALAFVLERKGARLGKKIVELKDAAHVGSGALIINDTSCIRALKDFEEYDEYKKSGVVLGLRIYTKSGQDLGVIEDILFDYKTGHIEGVEISDGLLQDIIKGRNILPLFGRVEFNDENILVDKEAIDEMMSTGGGLKRLLSENEHKC